MTQTENKNSRNGKKWAVPEILKLQREYELLELPVNEIASLHQRGVDAILFRLLKEGFIDTIESARGYVQKKPRETARYEFNQYIDYLLSENKMTINEIMECVAEKNKSISKTKPRRILRSYKTK